MVLATEPTVSSTVEMVEEIIHRLQKQHERRALVVDIHHHFFPDFLDKAKASTAVGWQTPQENLPWSAQVSLDFMNRAGIDFALLSFPAFSPGTPGADNRIKTRLVNDYAIKICRMYPQRFGFLATLPILDDTPACMEEIRYCAETLGCFGFSLPSSSGEGPQARIKSPCWLGVFSRTQESLGYVGHDAFDVVWKELNRRHAVVFLHGSQVPSSTPWPHETLGIPVSEVPNETFKAAAHLVVTGRKRKYPNVKIILAHLGGSTPFLAPRVAALSHYMGCSLTPEEILEDFRTFYFDTALSVSEENVKMVASFSSPDRILYGTDFPAVSRGTVSHFQTTLQSISASQAGHSIHQNEATDSKINDAIWSSNALRLFPQIRGLQHQFTKL
ncbi:hypothetical protein DL96DRAFT_1707182 [Flagelloscypha sp. PMI_526]|nr:hypothetical protein DL96DRAFT_1707182 [Flagelloscypha sp. PMI_526]